MLLHGAVEGLQVGPLAQFGTVEVGAKPQDALGFAGSVALSEDSSGICQLCLTELATALLV